MNTFTLHNINTLEQVDTIQVVNEPRIKSEINGAYTLEFEFSYLDRDKVNNQVLVQADGQYFIFSRINKFRNDSLTLSAFCEHVSYLLIGNYDFTEEDLLEGTASQLLNQTIRGTRFNIRGAYNSNSELYNSDTDNRRERLLELADLFRGELIFDNFDIELVERLGNFNTQTIQLGTNLLGVSEEIDYINNERSYEVDLVDLARLTGYESTQPIQLGDTVRITDEQLAINAYERVISIEYNPFNKSLPVITVGTYVRTFTQYLEEELGNIEEEEEVNVRDTLLNRFYIGELNVRENLSDERDGTARYLIGENPFPIARGSVTTVIKNGLQGLDIQLTSAADRFNKYIIRVTRENNRSVTTVTNFDDLAGSALSTKGYPEKDIESITLLLSDLTIEQLRMPLGVLGAEFYTFGITVTVDDSSRANQYLYRFDIGENDVLGQLSNEFVNVRDYINGVNNYVIPTAKFRLPKLDNELQNVTQRFETLRGLFVELLEEVALRNYNFTFINSQISEEGILTTEEYAWSSANGSQTTNRLITRAFSEGFTFVIHERPLADYAANPRLYFSTVFDAFGIEVIKDIPQGDPLELFRRFQVGNFDLINSLSNQMNNVAQRFSTNGIFAVPQNEFEITERQIGLFVEQQVTNVGGYLTLIDQRINGDIVINGEIIPYGPDVELFNYTATYEKRGIIIISSSIPFDQLTGENLLDNLRGAFGVTIRLNEKIDTADKFLNEFTIGNVNMLPNVSNERDKIISFVNGTVVNPIASSSYETRDTLLDLVAQLKQEYQSYNLTVVNTYTSSTNLQTDVYTYEEFKQNDPVEAPFQGKDDSFILVITEVPFSDLNTNNIGTAFIRAFGVNIKSSEPPTPQPPQENNNFYRVLKSSNLQNVTFRDNAARVEVSTVLNQDDFLSNLENRQNIEEDNNNIERFLSQDLYAFLNTINFENAYLLEVNGVIISCISSNSGGS